MNKIINTLFLVLGTIYCFAQTSTDYKWSIGIALQPNHLNKYNKREANNSLLIESRTKYTQANGFSIGVTASRNISRKASINMGLLYTENIKNTKDYFYGKTFYNLDTPIQYGNTSELLHYIKVPISFQYNIPIIKNRSIYYYIEPSLVTSFLVNYNSKSVFFVFNNPSLNDYWILTTNKFHQYDDKGTYNNTKNSGLVYTGVLFGYAIHSGFTIIDKQHTIKLGVLAQYDFSNTDNKNKYSYTDGLYGQSVQIKLTRVPTHNYITGLNLSWLYNF